MKLAGLEDEKSAIDNDDFASLYDDDEENNEMSTIDDEEDNEIDTIDNVNDFDEANEDDNTIGAAQEKYCAIRAMEYSAGYTLAAQDSSQYVILL